MRERERKRRFEWKTVEDTRAEHDVTCHCECIQIGISGRKRWVSIIATLVIVVFHVEAAQFRILDAQSAA